MQKSDSKEAPICECGQPITRKGKTGPWPKRCQACAVREGRAKSLRWYYANTDAELGEIRSRYPSRIGRPQTDEHIHKRAEAVAQTLAKQRRVCQACGEEYTPTQGGQRYCEKHRRVGHYRSRPYDRRIYLPNGLYEQILEKQGGRCAICGKEASGNRFAIDHSHETGEIRGLLCYQCNTGLGSFRDDSELLRKAIAYLSDRRELTQ